MFVFGQRAAHVAARNTSMLDVLLSFGADLNLRSEWANGPFAVLDNADEASARFLISRGATLTANVASRLGWISELRRIVEENPAAVHERGGDGQQPLHLVRTVEIADYLLDRGAAIESRCIDHHSTPAQYALTDRTDVCRRLLERGAEPDVFMAAWLGDLALAEQALRSHAGAIEARVNEPGYRLVPPLSIYCWTLGFGVSPHAIASRRGHREVYELLLRRSPPRLTFIDGALRGDVSLARETLREHPEVFETLTPADHGQLALAIFHGRFDAADAMLELGFDPSAGGKDGGTALHAAAWMGHLPLVDRLISSGRIPIDLRDPTHDSTPLGWAVFGSVHRCAPHGDYQAVIDRLVGAGADVGVPGNGEGLSYLQMADGNPDVETRLRQHGAR
jgi:ankyrin repeat protein